MTYQPGHVSAPRNVASREVFESDWTGGVGAGAGEPGRVEIEAARDAALMRSTRISAYRGDVKSI